MFLFLYSILLTIVFSSFFLLCLQCYLYKLLLIDCCLTLNEWYLIAILHENKLTINHVGKRMASWPYFIFQVKDDRIGNISLATSHQRSLLTNLFIRRCCMLFSHTRSVVVFTINRTLLYGGLALLVCSAWNDIKIHFVIRDRPFNLRGVMFFCFVQNFSFGKHKSYNIFFQNLT